MTQPVATSQARLLFVSFRSSCCYYCEFAELIAAVTMTEDTDDRASSIRSYLIAATSSFLPYFACGQASSTGTFAAAVALQVLCRRLESQGLLHPHRPPSPLESHRCSYQCHPRLSLLQTRRAACCSTTTGPGTPVNELTLAEHGGRPDPPP